MNSATSLSDSPAPDTAPENESMVIDRVMPEFDATRIEHRVIDGTLAEVYRAVMEADFVKAWKSNDVVRALFAVRTQAEHLVMRLQGNQPTASEEPASLRLADMTENGEWVRLGENEPHEFAFGAIGRFASGETVWRNSDASEFASFAEPGWSRIACNFSLRPYGAERTLVTYESRTQANDPDSRRTFLRYWRLVHTGVGIVMRAQLAVIAEEAARS